MIEALLDMARRALPLGDELRTRHIPNGVDVSVFRPGDRAEARHALDLPPDAPILLATAEALVRLGKGLGWRVSLVGLEVTRERFPEADHIFDSLDLSQLAITKNAHIVVASHGNYDEDMLVAALQSEAPYVALVASKKRASAILEYLNEANLTQAQRDYFGAHTYRRVDRPGVFHTEW